MTIQEAIVAALNDWSKDPKFDINEQMGWVNQKVSDTMCDWAVENGYTFNDETCDWEKKP